MFLRNFVDLENSSFAAEFFGRFGMLYNANATATSTSFNFAINFKIQISIQIQALELTAIIDFISYLSD